MWLRLSSGMTITTERLEAWDEVSCEWPKVSCCRPDRDLSFECECFCPPHRIPIERTIFMFGLKWPDIVLAHCVNQTLTHLKADHGHFLLLSNSSLTIILLIPRYIIYAIGKASVETTGLWDSLCKCICSAVFPTVMSSVPASLHSSTQYQVVVAEGERCHSKTKWNYNCFIHKDLIVGTESSSTDVCVPRLSGGTETVHIISYYCVSLHLKLCKFALLAAGLTVMRFLALGFQFSIGVMCLNLRSRTMFSLNYFTPGYWNWFERVYNKYGNVGSVVLFVILYISLTFRYSYFRLQKIIALQILHFIKSEIIYIFFLVFR
jgi:hypothetical protein